MAKWVRENYKGEKVVWYSGDVIEKIKELAKSVYDDEENEYQASGVCWEILKIIESEDE